MQIIKYDSKYKDEFKRLNVAWLQDMFVVEPYDLEVLSNPGKYILSEGGEIWFIQGEDGEILGTCALMQHKDKKFELTKMSVSKSARGGGLGRKLLKYVIGKAYEEKNAEELFLLTNKRCESAIYLYKEEGFEESLSIEKAYGAFYDRCDLGMVHIRNEKALRPKI